MPSPVDADVAATFEEGMLCLLMRPVDEMDDVCRPSPVGWKISRLKGTGGCPVRIDVDGEAKAAGSWRRKVEADHSPWRRRHESEESRRLEIGCAMNETMGNEEPATGR